MSRFVLVVVGVLFLLSWVAVEASAGGRMPPRTSASTEAGYSYRSYSGEPQIDRRSALRRAPYTVQSNIWRGDRKMFQTYWDRQPGRP
jgi:hypothetical protein